MYDDDMKGFLTIMTVEECIKMTREILNNDPLALHVANTQHIDDAIREGLNKTRAPGHLLCAQLEGNDGDMMVEVCSVIYNHTLASNIETYYELHGNKEFHGTIVKEIYENSCSYDRNRHKLVEVKVVSSVQQCAIFNLALKPTLIFQPRVLIPAIVLACFCAVTNILAMTVYLSTDYQRSYHISVYFLVKALFDELFLIIMVIFLLGLLKPGIFYWVLRDIIYIVVVKLSYVGHNWISAVLSIERSIAVLAPMFARAHFGRCLSIKVSIGTAVASVLIVTADTLIIHFKTALANIFSVDDLFMGGEIKMAFHFLILAFLLPWIIVLVCTILTAIAIKISSIRRARLTNSTSSGPHTQQSETQNTNTAVFKMGLICLIAFLITGAPFISAIIIVIVGSTPVKMLGSSLGIEIYSVFSLFFTIICFSLDFFLMLLQVEFRRQLKRNILVVICWR